MIVNRNPSIEAALLKTQRARMLQPQSSQRRPLPKSIDQNLVSVRSSKHLLNHNDCVNPPSIGGTQAIASFLPGRRPSTARSPRSRVDCRYSTSWQRFSWMRRMNERISHFWRWSGSRQRPLARPPSLTQRWSSKVQCQTISACMRLLFKQSLQDMPT